MTNIYSLPIPIYWETAVIALSMLAEDNKLLLTAGGGQRAFCVRADSNPKIITGHTGWADDINFVFAHTAEVCNVNKPVK